jgi:hypothetical protein
MVAAVGGHQETLRLLLARGAAVDAVDHRGSTAFHYACFSNQADCAEALAWAGCDVGIKTTAGLSGRDLAEQKGRAAVPQWRGCGRWNPRGPPAAEEEEEQEGQEEEEEPVVPERSERNERKIERPTRSLGQNWSWSRRRSRSRSRRATRICWSCHRRLTGGDTCHSTLSRVVIDCRCLGVCTVVLLSLLSLSANMTMPPWAAGGGHRRGAGAGARAGVHGPVHGRHPGGGAPCCTAARPLHTRFAIVFGAFVFEATV